jgi:hypothetical protein
MPACILNTRLSLQFEKCYGIFRKGLWISEILLAFESCWVDVVRRDEMETNAGGK